MTAPRFSSLTGRGAGMAVPSAGIEFKPYVYGGTRRWDPDEPARAEGRPREDASVQAAARRAKFALLRTDGRSVTEAGEAVGIAPATAVKYERRRRREAGGGR